MKKLMIMFLILVFALSVISAANTKFWIKDSVDIEWLNSTTYTKSIAGVDNMKAKDTILNLGWAGIDNYLSWGASADIFKGENFRMDFSFWDGLDIWFATKNGSSTNLNGDWFSTNLLDIEPEFNNSLNFHFGDIYDLTVGIRPQFELFFFSPVSNFYSWSLDPGPPVSNPSAQNSVNFLYGLYDASIENVIKIPQVMDINAKWYFREMLDSGLNNTLNVALMTAIGSPGIWTGDPFRAYMGNAIQKGGTLWDPVSEWQMGFKNNHGVWPGYSFGLGWMFNSIVIMQLDPRYSRDYEVGAQAPLTNEQYSVYQQTIVNLYFGICENISKLLGIKGVDITLMAEEALSMHVPYATGTEITKTIYTGGYYGFAIGWNGLNWDLCMVLNTRDTYDKSRPLQKDDFDAVNRGDWQNPSTMLGFATRLKFTANNFEVFGEYVGFAEVRKYDSYKDTNGSTVGTANSIWFNYIKIQCAFNF